MFVLVDFDHWTTGVGTLCLWWMKKQPSQESSDPENSGMEHAKPWRELHEHIQAEDSVSVTELLGELNSDDQRRVFSRLPGKDQSHAVELLPTEEAADVIENLPGAQATDILKKIEPATAAEIVGKLPAQTSTDLLQGMVDDCSDAIIGELENTEDAAELREMAGYASDSAGGLMSTSVVAFPSTHTVADVLKDLRENADTYSDRDVQYFYVVNADRVLKGVLRLRDLVLTRGAKPISAIMLTDPKHVEVDTDLKTLKAIFEEHGFFGLPVIDDRRILKGVVSRTEVDEAIAEHFADDFLAASGIVGGEELRSMPMHTRCMRRLSWLAPNIVLNIIAASVIAMYEDTIQQIIALAVFLPIVSDMSGCSGNQAVAVSMRELTLNLIRPIDYMRVVWKEGILGIVNGTVLGILLGTIAGMWKGNFWLGLVIGGALALNTVLSVLLGGLVPLILKRLKIDPALASGPILTTCTDMCGFFLVLNLATLALSKLV